MSRDTVQGRIENRLFNRGDFLKIGGAGLAFCTLLGTSRPASGIESKSKLVNVRSLGIEPGNDGVTNRENLVKALRYSKRRVSFPKGDYLIDNSAAAPERGLNSGGVINIDSFEGELVMEDGARLVFTNGGRRGLVFYGGSGMTVRGLNTAFRDRPKRRVAPQECITFDKTTATLVKDTVIDGSAAAGIVFWECVRPVVNGAVIRNTMADGLHFANCQDARAENITTRNTGDDGLAFINYRRQKGYTGGYARNISVSDSKARGICVAGQSRVTIEDFEVDGTNASGLMCAYDGHWDTRVPENVTFRNGVVRNAGKVRDPAGKSGNRFGIEIDTVGNTTFSNVEVISTAGRGVSGVISRKVAGTTVKGRVELKNVAVRDSLEEGFSFYGVPYDAPSSAIPESGTYKLTDLSASNTGGPGMVFMKIDRLEYENLTSSGTSRVNSLRRAFWFEENLGIYGNGLHVIDGKSKPTGYKVATNRDRGVRIGRVYDRVSNGKLILENQSKLDCQILVAAKRKKK